LSEGEIGTEQPQNPPPGRLVNTCPTRNQEPGRQNRQPKNAGQGIQKPYEKNPGNNVLNSNKHCGKGQSPLTHKVWGKVRGKQERRPMSPKAFLTGKKGMTPVWSIPAGKGRKRIRVGGTSGLFLQEYHRKKRRPDEGQRVTTAWPAGKKRGQQERAGRRGGAAKGK